MARKFSLKDNPIFQRLEVPKPRETSSQPDATDSSAEVDIDEGQKETRKFRPANFDPQILTRKEKERVRAAFGEDAVARRRERKGHLPEARFTWEPLGRRVHAAKAGGL